MIHSPLPTAKAHALLNTLHAAERLKFELRHSCTSTRRVESVAEHCWRASLMAVLLAPYLSAHADLGRILELLVIHDLCEVYAGDTPLFDALARAEERTRAEAHAMERLCTQLPTEAAQRLHDVWDEYRRGQSMEARIAHTLDKLEAQLQHNEAPLDTWTEWEKARVYGGLDELGADDPVLRVLREVIVAEAGCKLAAHSEAAPNSQQPEERSKIYSHYLDQ